LWEQIFEIELKLCPGKEIAPNDPNLPFKEKEKGGEGRSKARWPMEGSMLGGQWNVPSLVANGRFHARWPMEGSKFGGQWNVKENTFSLLPISPPTNFT
jgi:hypothetical protein